jgi:FkbM family methyltransferase
LNRRIGPPWGDQIFDITLILDKPRYRAEAIIRSLCSTAHLGDDTAVCRVLGRYKMFVDTRDDGLSPHLMLDGYWELWLVEEFLRTVRRGMKVIDIGANLGFFTLLLAELVGSAGCVHAFEPNKAMKDRLMRSLRLNGLDRNTSVHDVPLGAEDGRKVNLSIPYAEPKNATVVTATEGSGLPVLETRRFDSYADLLDADVIKIDVEGAEEDIWDGMAGFFEASRKPLTIFLEFTPNRYIDAAAFLDKIISRGFALAELTLDRGVVPRTRQEVLAAPPATDQMLVLKR